MKHFIFIFIIVGIVYSCKVPERLTGVTYKYKSLKRTLRLEFINDSLCKIVNIFDCDDIEPEVKEISIECKYFRRGDTIFLRNSKYIDSLNTEAMFYNIPYQESKDCFFLNSENRNKRWKYSPNYPTSYETYGLVPQIDVDTIYIYKNKLLLIKQDSSMRLIYLFR